MDKDVDGARRVPARVHFKRTHSFSGLLGQKCPVYFHESAAATDKRKQQVLPLRFAPVRMTTFLEMGDDNVF